MNIMKEIYLQAQTNYWLHRQIKKTQGDLNSYLQISFCKQIWI